MELIIMIGLQGSGKSTFCREYFYDTHLRLNLDMLNTRNKERQLFETALKLQQSVVIDNTNVTLQERAYYIEKVRARRFPSRIIGYHIDVDFALCLARNNRRENKAKIPEVGIKAAAKRFVKPKMTEGFNKLFRVTCDDDQFIIKEVLE